MLMTAFDVPLIPFVQSFTRFAHHYHFFAPACRSPHTKLTTFRLTLRHEPVDTCIVENSYRDYIKIVGVKRLKHLSVRDPELLPHGAAYLPHAYRTPAASMPRRCRIATATLTHTLREPINGI